MRFLLVGNYGVSNVGDEALKEYFLRAFPDVEWHVVSARPQGQDLPRLPSGFRSFFRFRWIRTLRELQRADGMVFGGGTLFTDAESVRACVIWGMHAFIARLYRKPVVLAFQGIGPFRTALGRLIARRVLRSSSFLSARDALSQRRAQRLAPGLRVGLTADPVILSVKGERKASMSAFASASAPAQGILLVLPRGNSSAAFLERARQLIAERAWSAVHVLSLQPSPREKAVARDLEAPGSNISYRKILDLEALVREVTASSFVLTQRYHGGIVAACLGVPFAYVSQAGGDKLSSLQSLRDASLDTLRETAKAGQKALDAALHSIAARTRPLREGSKAPAFDAADQDGNRHTLERYRGAWVLLYFYSEDDTPGCTKEACGFRDALEDLRGKLEVVGVSPDSAERHRTFREKYRLSFPLLVDENGSLARSYGADGQSFPKRTSFLIGPDGRLVKIYDHVVPADHAVEVQRDLEDLRR